MNIRMNNHPYQLLFILNTVQVRTRIKQQELQTIIVERHKDATKTGGVCDE